MRDVVVIYKSKYGAVKKYAAWIADEADADMFEEGRITAEQAAKHGTIVVGGGVYAGKIAGMSFVRKNFELFSGKRLLLFAVGGSENSTETVDKLKKANLSPEMKDVPFFYLRGALDVEKLKFPAKGIMRAMVRSAQKRGEPAAMSYDFTSRESLQPLLEAIFE